MTDNAKTFNERIAYWTSRGKTGADVYEALATDTQLPAFFTSNDVSKITGLALITVRTRRARGCEPSFIKQGPTRIRYPRAELARWFATSFVEVAAA